MSGVLTFANGAAAAGKFGAEVPIHCLRPHVFAQRARAFADSFPGRVLYSVKANPDPICVSAVAAGGIRDFDVASIGELMRIKDLLPSARVHFMHPIKSRRAIAVAHQHFGVKTFAFDSAQELTAICEETGKAPDLALQLRIDVPSEHSRWGFSGKFGATYRDAVDLLRAARRRAARVGLTFHVGSLCLDPRAFTEALGLVAAIAKSAGVPLDIVNVGGGFPAAYLDIAPPPLTEYFAAIASALAAVSLRPDFEIWSEPGRALAADGGSLIVEVMRRRGDILHISDGIYGSLAAPGPPPPHFGLPMRTAGPYDRNARLAPFHVFGPTCDGTDKLSGLIDLPADIAQGDWIEIGQHGAYGATLRSDFNGLIASRTVVVTDDPMPIELPGQTINSKEIHEFDSQFS